MEKSDEEKKQNMQLRKDMEKILETLLFIKTEAYSNKGQVEEFLCLFQSDKFKFMRDHLDTLPIYTNVVELLTNSSTKLRSTLNYIESIEDLIEETKQLYCHIFHIKSQSILFEVYYMLNQLVQIPQSSWFEFLSEYINQISSFQSLTHEIIWNLKPTSFDFTNLKDIVKLI